MAQIKIKRGSGTPSGLSFAELAYDYANQKLYIGITSGSVLLTPTSGGITFYYQSSAPAGVSTGTRWMSSDTGIESIYIDDGNSSQWVQPTYLGIQGPPGPQGPTGATGATGATGSGGGGGSTTKTEINAQTGTTYSPVLTDAGKLITLSNASNITLTIPADSSVAFDQGTLLYFAQLDDGIVGITGEAGVTVVSTPGLYLRTKYSSASAIKLNTDYWIVSGDLSI